jgi:DNA-binding helix-hairpin-helix protein with protein kinase domain
MNGQRASIAEAEKQDKALKSALQQKESELTQEHNQAKSELVAKRDAIKEAKDRELGSQHLIEEAYVHNAMSEYLIETADIPGISSKLKTALWEHGIKYAGQITDSTISALPGFGRVKTVALIAWREVVKTRIKLSIPKDLSSVKSAIAQKYQEQLDQVERDLAESETKHSADLDLVRQEFALFRQVNQENLDALHLKEDTIRQEQEGLRAKMEQMKGVSYLAYLRQCLAASMGEFALPSFISANILLVVLALLSTSILIVSAMSSHAKPSWHLSRPQRRRPRKQTHRPAQPRSP